METDCEERAARVRRIKALLLERELELLPRAAERTAADIVGKTPDQIRMWWRKRDGSAEYAERLVECVRDAEDDGAVGAVEDDPVGVGGHDPDPPPCACGLHIAGRCPL